MASDSNPGASGTPALEARRLSKRFGGNLALAGVDLTVDQGEVLALLGENGSGKSTFVKILSGFHAPEPGGEVLVAGRQVPLPVPHGEYRDYGLSFVYQDLGLGLGLRVVENLFVGRRTGSPAERLNPINWWSERRAARAVLEDYQVDLDPNALVGSLRPTAQALLAIVRASEDLRLFRERVEAESGRVDGSKQGESVPYGVLVLDEPTVFLPQDEKVFLFDLVGRVAASGTAVLFVSHDMPAVRQLANRAVILRDGAVTADVQMAQTSDEELVEYISGHRLTHSDDAAAQPAEIFEPELPRARSHEATGPASMQTRLAAEGVSGGRLQGVDLRVDTGEIVGVAGLLGSGADDLPYALFGALPGAHGNLQVGEWSGDIAGLDPRGARRVGLALVPADRKQQGIGQELTVGENLMSLVLGDYYRYGYLDRRKLRRTAEQRCQSYGVRPPDPSTRIAFLSGGNQQRVVLARWLEDPPLVLLLHEPTQGVDVATRAELYEMLRGLAKSGTSILWVSTDFDELAEVADRVLICSDGVVAAELSTGPITRDRITAEVYSARTEPLAKGA